MEKRKENKNSLFVVCVVYDLGMYTNRDSLYKFSLFLDGDKWTSHVPNFKPANLERGEVEESTVNKK